MVYVPTSNSSCSIYINIYLNYLVDSHFFSITKMMQLGETLKKSVITSLFNFLSHGMFKVIDTEVSDRYCVARETHSQTVLKISHPLQLRLIVEVRASGDVMSGQRSTQHTQGSYPCAPSGSVWIKFILR